MWCKSLNRLNNKRAQAHIWNKMARKAECGLAMTLPLVHLVAIEEAQECCNCLRAIGQWDYS